MESQMLCYQCGNAKEGRCCNDTVGACGKSAETSRLQDELTGALVGLAKASVHKSIDEEIQRLMVEGLAATAAHTDFDNEKILALTEQAKAAKTKFVPKFGGYNTSLKLPEDFDIRIIWQKSPDIRSLKSLLLFGIRGIALYAHESWALGSKNKEAAGFFHKALIALGANHFKEDYYTLLEEMGGISLRAMEQANKARLNAYGSPSPVSVPRVIDPGPFIIVSGHHFEILAQILEQTKDTGVNVYSHGEMLPAHAYPEFRKYPQFKGHYGTGWQNQQQEFDHIPAAIVFTSGCMDLPLPSYADRVFTAGNARISGVPHLEQDFTPAIIAAIEQGGAPEQIAFPGVNGGTSVTTGFGRKTIRTVSYKLAAALAEGNLHHIYVVGGCDGNEANRSAYTDLIRRIPDDAVVFTWGCAKYRFNDIHYGEIDGVPRILDLGLCSDLPVVVETIEALAESAKLRVEELPLTWHYTWQGQRSTAEIFALFAADVQNVILGPALPPYFTAEVFRALAKEYNMSLFNGEATENGADAVPVAEAEPTPAEIPEEIAAEAEILTEEPAEAEEEIQKDSPYTPEELEERSEAAGLPDWAVMSEEEEAEAEAAAAEVRAEAAKAKPKIRPEDLDQSPAWLTADDDDEDEPSENIPEEPKMDIEARSEAAGLPAWAMEDEDEEDEDEDDGPAVEFIVKDGKAMPVFASENTAPAEAEPTPAPKPAEPLPAKSDIVLGETAVSGGENAPKIVLPKGKGVSGWKDPDDEPSFTPGDRKPYRYTPPKELVEIPQPAPIALPAGAGISGYAADHSYDRDTGEDTVSALYSFAEPQPEIKIPKGKGVSGWKEEDDTPRPIKRGDSEKSGEKPWLKKSLERLHAEVEEANAPAAPIPSAVPEPQTEPKESAEPKAEATAPTETPSEPAIETDPAKPWLAASLKQLKESIEADQEAEANKNSDKPWLQASLNALHAEVEAEQNGGETPSAAETAAEEDREEVYVSNFKHDADAAAEKPWLKTSIEELKESIDRDAGIKSVRSEKKGPAKEKTDEEVAARWQNTGERKSWKDIVPPGEKAAAAAAPVENAAASTDNTVPAAPLAGEPTDEPSGGGEPPEMWQKPKVMPKPWDKDLQTVWKKPDVLPKPWEMQQPTMYHNPDAQGNTEQVIPNIPLGNPNPRAAEEQQRAQAIAQQQAQQQAIAQQQAQQQAIAQQQAQQQAIAQQQAQQQAIAQQQAQQQAIAQQQAQQQAIAQQQAQQQAIAQQQAQQQAIAQQQAQQQALAEQQARVQQQQQAAYEAEQRALAARQDLEEQAARIRAAQAAQEAYAAQLREQAYRMEEARAQQAEAAARLAQQEQQLRAAQQQAERQVSRQSMRSRQEQAAYAAQLEQQAQQLRAAQAEQNAYRAQLEQQAARMRSAQDAQANQAARLAQQEQQLRQAMEQQSRQQQAFAQQQALAQQQAQQQAIAQQQAAQNPYQFGGNFFREEPVTLPPDAGVSGYRQTTFVPGQERPGANINDAIRTLPGVPQTAPQAIPANAGISGSHYHEELPPIMTDYTQTCYGVPQTPKVNLPQGAGVSGWNDPNPPMNAAPVQNNFFGFMNSDAPAGVRSNTEVITPGSGDEFIATKGPDGEVTVTIRSDKNK